MTAEEKKNLKTNKRSRSSVFITTVVDVVLLLAFVISLLLYSSANAQNTYEQNVQNVSDISKANAQLLQVAVNNLGDELTRAYNYCNGKSEIDILDYLSNTITEDEEYQLLYFDAEQSEEFDYIHRGYSTKKVASTFVGVEYDGTTGLSKSIINYGSTENGEISFTQSFTNQTDTLRYFAVFTGISVSGTSRQYFLVKLQSESKVLNYVQTNSQYKNLAVAVCYIDGKYMAYDETFRSNNIFDYFYKYNGLTLDEKTQLMESVQNNQEGHGTLTFNNYKGEECIFAYSISGQDREWLAIASVPVSEFVSQRSLSVFPWVVIIFLAVLLVFNILMLLSMVFQLRLSVEREQSANMSKTSFLSRMSHEIRTPLNAVIGYNSIGRQALDGVMTDAERRVAETKVLDCLNKSEIASKQLLFVINDVLDMSAIESGRIKIANEKFDFKALVSTLTMVYYSQAKSKDINFEVLFDTVTEEWFNGDQMRVNQILTNLLSNALKFTPRGGYIVLRISQPDGTANASHIRFEIIDTGIGMSEEYLQKIWNPFEQADSSISRRFGGTGLGLSITKSLVDLMGGTISVKSTLGVGSTFTVDLNFGLVKHEEISAPVTYDFSSVNVLVVDDDFSTRDYISSLFIRCGARCTAVKSGQEAINAVRMSLSNNDRYSMCLVDWQMPGMDGMETIEHIHQIALDSLPIIVITAYDYAEIADKAIELGVTKFIAKPLFQSSLFDLLADVCGVREVSKSENRDTVGLNGLRVLLAEDNKMNMEIAKILLQSAGITVECATDGRQALDKFCVSQEGTYFAILMDVHMPEMDGLQATRLIRISTHPEASTIPIIAMTADAFVEDIAETKAAGMNDHISKPVDVNILFATLQKYIKRNPF